MRIGSIVRLTRPLSVQVRYTNAIGVVENIRESLMDSSQMICSVRFEDYSSPLSHVSLGVFQHRLDLLRE